MMPTSGTRRILEGPRIGQTEIEFFDGSWQVIGIVAMSMPVSRASRYVYEPKFRHYLLTLSLPGFKNGRYRAAAFVGGIRVAMTSSELSTELDMVIATQSWATRGAPPRRIPLHAVPQ
jgi:hypothetical protein